MQITEQKLQEITSFIQEESSKLENEVGGREDIFVCLPYWLFTLFQYHFRATLSTSINVDESNTFFFGCKVQFHFRDEIVVFFKDYYINRELFEPKIYIIN